MVRCLPALFLPRRRLGQGCAAVAERAREIYLTSPHSLPCPPSPSLPPPPNPLPIEEDTHSHPPASAASPTCAACRFPQDSEPVEIPVSQALVQTGNRCSDVPSPFSPRERDFFSGPPHPEQPASRRPSPLPPSARQPLPPSARAACSDAAAPRKPDFLLISPLPFAPSRIWHLTDVSPRPESATYDPPNFSSPSCATCSVTFHPPPPRIRFSNECSQLERAKPSHRRIPDRCYRARSLVRIVRQRGRWFGSTHCPLVRKRDQEELNSSYRVQRCAACGSGCLPARSTWQELVRVTRERQNPYPACAAQHGARHRQQQQHRL